MIDSNHSEEAPDTIQVNQFLDPPIRTHDRSDAPEESIKDITVKSNEEEHSPTIAPGMDTHNSLEENATDTEKEGGDYTEVTRLYLDRTPND